MASRESNTVNEVRDKRPTTSWTFSDETVKATIGGPGGSGGGGLKLEGEGGVDEEGEQLACLFAH